MDKGSDTKIKSYSNIKRYVSILFLIFINAAFLFFLHVLTEGILIPFVFISSLFNSGISLQIESKLKKKSPKLNSCELFRVLEASVIHGWVRVNLALVLVHSSCGSSLDFVLIRVKIWRVAGIGLGAHFMTLASRLVICFCLTRDSNLVN